MKPRRAAQLYGTIRDPAGRGIPEVAIYLEIQESRYTVEAFRAETDSAGAFRIRVPEGEYFPVLWTGFPGRFPRVDLGPFRVTAPATRLDYIYGGHRVSGGISGPGGTSVDSGIVSVYSVNPTPYDTYVDIVVPFAGGRYETYLPTGDYAFWFRPGGPPLGIPSRRLEVYVSADTTMDVLLDGHPISGSVALGPGVPLSGASVQASSQEASARAETGASGSYTIYLPSGDYDWSVIPGPSESYVFPLAQAGPGVSGPGTLDFDLSGVSWGGTVRLSPLGTPVSGAQVSAQLTGLYPFATSTTDGGGLFHLVLRASRRYTLYVGAPGTVTTAVAGVLAGNDSTFDLMLAPAPATNP